MTTDPRRSYFGHPILPAGYNADDNNGDEIDGAGTNWPIWPVLFDTFVGMTPVIVTDEMLDVFDNTCPDYIAPAERSTSILPAEAQELAVGGIWNDYALAAVSDVVVVVQRGPRDVKIRHTADDVTLAPAPGTATLSSGPQTHMVRRKA